MQLICLKARPPVMNNNVRNAADDVTFMRQEVRRQLAPWEQQISEVQSRLGVAISERDMLHKSHADAKQRLQVRVSPFSIAVHLSCCFHKALPCHCASVAMMCKPMLLHLSAVLYDPVSQV